MDRIGLADLLQHLADDQTVRLLVLGAEVDLVLVLGPVNRQVASPLEVFSPDCRPTSAMNAASL
jgi:hypothetical protein